MSEIQLVQKPGTSPTKEALNRIMEVRKPLSGGWPRGWLTVGLQDTIAWASLPVALIAGAIILGHMATRGLPTTLQGWLSLIQ